MRERCSGADDLATWQQRFHDAHQRRYGHMAQAEAVEIVNFQVTAVGRIPKPATKRFDPGTGPRPQTPFEIRQAYFNGDRRLRRPGLAPQRPALRARGSKGRR